MGTPHIGMGRDMSRVVYRGVTSSFFGIGILLVSDLLDFRYRSVSFPPFLYTSPFSSPLFFQKGVGAPQKGGHCPPFEEKGGHCPLFYTEMYRPNFPSVSVRMVNTEKYRPNTDRKYRDNISHLFYPEYNHKIEVSKVKNSMYLLLIYSKV